MIFVLGARDIPQTDGPSYLSGNFFSSQMRLKQFPAPRLQTPSASANRGRSASQIRPARCASAVPSKCLPEMTHIFNILNNRNPEVYSIREINDCDTFCFYSSQSFARTWLLEFNIKTMRKDGGSYNQGETRDDSDSNEYIFLVKKQELYCRKYYVNSK